MLITLNLLPVWIQFDSKPKCFFSQKESVMLGSVIKILICQWMMRERLLHSREFFSHIMTRTGYSFMRWWCLIRVLALPHWNNIQHARHVASLPTHYPNSEPTNYTWGEHTNNYSNKFGLHNCCFLNINEIQDNNICKLFLLTTK